MFSKTFRPFGSFRLAGGGQEEEMKCYLLHDDFTDPHAAGAVNGTLATDGANVRKVTDSSSKVSISGGELLIAGAASSPGYNDPAEGYGAFDTVLGKALCIQINSIDTGILPFGWSRAAKTASIEYGDGVMLYNGNIIGHTFSANTSWMGTYTAGAYYNYVEIMKGVKGNYKLIKGGTEYPNWTLLWPETTETNAELYYPTLSNYNAHYKVKTVRIPYETLPLLCKPLVTDSFTRINSASLGNADGLAEEDAALSTPAWADALGVCGISGNKAVFSSLTGGAGIETINVGAADVHCMVTPTRTSGSVGLLFWYTDGSNYGKVIHNGTNIVMTTVIAGVESAPIISAAKTLGEIRVITNGTAVFVYCNGELVDTVYTISTLAPANTFALFTTNTGNTFSNFKCWGRFGGGYSYLDRFFL
jgi:hypothetical protein